MKGQGPKNPHKRSSRIRNRVSKEKIVMIAEAIFNSLLRYGVAVFLKPVYDEEDLKMKKFPKNTIVLQTLQNSAVIRVIYGLKKRIMLI
jgi:hypothetical protein